MTEQQDPKKAPSDGPGGAESSGGSSGSGYDRPGGGSPERGKQSSGGGSDSKGSSPEESSESADEQANVDK